MRIKTNYLCVLDLEATCYEIKKPTNAPSEIIEIGAVMVSIKNLEPISEFQDFVKPAQSKELSEFCTSLTSITQDDVDHASIFPAVHRRFVEWLSKFSSSSVLFASQGLYDYKQLIKDCAFHKMPFPFRGDHLNLKEHNANRMGWTRRGIGQGNMIKRLGLTLEGTAHRGIDDARMAVKILQKVGYTADPGQWYRLTADAVMCDGRKTRGR